MDTTFKIINLFKYVFRKINIMSDPDPDNAEPSVSALDHDESDSIPSKKRKIHLDHIDCRDLTEHEGGDRLRHPNSVSFSSRDPNRGLYPRVGRKNPGPASGPPATMGSGFVTAREAMNPTLPFINASQLQSQGSVAAAADQNETVQSGPSWWKPKQNKNKLPQQKNTLDKYCVKKSQSSTAMSNSQSGSQNCSQSSSSSWSSSQGSQPKTTKMYKPIQKMEEGTNSVFYNGSPTKSQLSVSDMLFNSQRSNKGGKTKTKKSKKPPPKFNRDNPFLYSQGLAKRNTKSESASTFGLLGDAVDISSEEEEEEICWFDYLPIEVMENILCRLPLLDLCLNVNMVCKGWNEIISKETFMSWKKKYWRLKKSDRPALEDMMTIMTDSGMTTSGVMKVQDLLPQLIRYMKEFGGPRRAAMSECLKARHPKYAWAVALLKERCPDCFLTEEASPWSVVTVLITVLSERVRDVEHVLSALLNNPASTCTVDEVLQGLYAILSFLFLFKRSRNNDVWNGMHYRLLYALYLFENESSCTLAELNHVFKDSSGQQSLLRYSKRESSVQYTHEQLRICSYSVQPGDVVKIVAFAGTGKTTTLVRYTQLRPNKRFLLVVYNKAIKEHASTHFPGNVTCKTGHGLAFGHVGRRYAAQKSKLGNLRVFPLTQVLQARKGESLFVQAKFVMDTINTFLASADDNIGPEHVPNEHVDDNMKRVLVDETMKMNLVRDAEGVWEMMKDITNSRIPMTHDGYLKLYQLRRPQLKDYDVILIDEAQDLTPAIADLLLNQRQPKILVGDPHQQIYAFRGAVNAMRHIPATHTFYLTQSFRFGPEIAFIAATCLEVLKKEKVKTLVGNKHQGDIHGSVNGQVAVITRTNFRLFAEAVDVCNKTHDEPFKVAFAGGIENFGLDMIMDIYLLMLPPDEREAKGGIKNKLVKNFRSLADLERYVQKTMDNELAGKIKIVKTYNTSLPAHIAKIKSRLTKDESTADMIFSTAHKAKGLEFSTVRITDDFYVDARAAGMEEDGLAPNEVSDDEHNLLYVAVSRAKRCLVITPTLKRLMAAAAGETYQYPEYTKALMEGKEQKTDGIGAASGKVCCIASEAEFVPHSLTLTRRKFKLSSGTVTASGPISPKVVSEDFPSLRLLLGVIPEKTPEEEKT